MRNLRMIALGASLVAFAFLVGCGGGSSSSSSGGLQTISSTGGNVAPISVNGGPAGIDYVDAAFASVTVCVPGTSTCQTVDNILVDTGSSGLRILSSVLMLPLPQQMSAGDPVMECFPFVSGYTWGPVQTADVEMASEKASSVPIQVVGTSTAVPESCSSFGTSSDTLDTLGANGIVGVGLFAQDCGDPTCPAVANIYYDCPSATSCTAITEASAQEVQNPVSLFTTDNNGVILELPSVTGGEEATLSGSMVFGIGTQSNNALGSATIYTADDFGDFSTTYNGVAYPESFIDSGSNGYYFLNSSLAGITECSDEPGFYCPATTQNFTATNQGGNGSSGTVQFTIENADTLFGVNDFAYSELGGISGTTAPYYFDWGLPFFFGRNVYTGLQSSTYLNGYWAY
jgi:hypothetical protein